MKTPIWESSSGALLTLMRTSRRCAMAHLFTVRLPTGVIERWTDWPEDLTVNGKTFRAPTKNPGHYLPPYVIPEDAGTVSHLVVQGGAIVDTKAGIWTTHGTVPIAASESLGFARTISAPSFGPFSAANFLELATHTGSGGSARDVFDFTGDFVVTAAMKAPSSLPTGIDFQVWLATEANGNEGIMARLDGATGKYVTWIAPRTLTPSHSAAGGEVVVVSIGRRGTTVVAKVNGESVVTSNPGYTFYPTSGPTYVGASMQLDAAYPWLGRIYELRASTSTPSDQYLADLHAAIRGA